jgi:hypothetical protein
MSDCPEVCCGAPFEIDRRFVLESTHGPVEHVSGRCAAGHHFLMPTEYLSVP